jgi:hypothetical protein
VAMWIASGLEAFDPWTASEAREAAALPAWLLRIPYLVARRDGWGRQNGTREECVMVGALVAAKN